MKELQRAAFEHCIAVTIILGLHDPSTQKTVIY
jgi:hypothetical protein